MSGTGSTSSRVISFGSFEVDVRSGELRREGRRIPLQDQPFRILARLLHHPGELVTRDELRRELWPDNTFLDFEHGVNAAIKRLRDALGDSADSPSFIETLPRRGYRFIAPVRAPVEPAASPADGGAVPGGFRRWHVIAAASILLLALTAAAGLWLKADFAGTPPEATEGTAADPRDEPVRRTVAVGRFVNRTADSALDPLGAQIAGRVVRAIAGVPGVEAVPDAIQGPAADDDNRAAAVVARARASGAVLLADGTMFVHGDRLEVQARVLDGSSGRLLHALPPFTALRNDPESAIDSLERHAAGAVAIHFDEFFGGLDSVSHPPPIDAYREYRAGLEIFSGDYPRAVAHLRRALEIAPRFSLPRVIMLFAHGNTGATDKAIAELSVLQSVRNSLTPAERLFIDFLREDREGRFAEALRVLEDLEPLVPGSLLVNHNIVQHSLLLNRPRAAVAAHDRLASDVRTLRYSIGTWRMSFLTHALHWLGEHERELAESRRGQTYAPAMLSFRAGEVRALAALGRLDDLQAAVERSLVIPAPFGRATDVLAEGALELRAHGHREASIALAARAVDWYREQPGGAANWQDRFSTGQALYLTERWSDALETFERPQTETKQPPQTEWEMLENLGWVGVCAARLGDIARARAVSAELERLLEKSRHAPHTSWRNPYTPAPGEYPYWRARIAALLGEHQSAVNLLRQARALGVSFGPWFHQEPDFEALRDYPPFQEVIRPQE